MDEPRQGHAHVVPAVRPIAVKSDLHAVGYPLGHRAGDQQPSPHPSPEAKYLPEAHVTGERSEAVIRIGTVAPLTAHRRKEPRTGNAT
jgi:hypothetical protein